MENIKIMFVELHKATNDIREKYLDYQERINKSFKHNSVLRSRTFRRKKNSIKPVENLTICRYFAFHRPTDEIVGQGIASYRDYDDDSNKHKIWFDISVLPAFRKNGIATVILSRLLKFANEHDKTLIEAGFYPIDTEVPAKWLERIGFKKVMQEKISRLFKENVNWDYINSVIQIYDHRMEEYNFVTYDHITWSTRILEDEKFAVEVADFLTEAVNLLPFEDAEHNEETVSPEDLKISANKLLETKDYRGSLNYYAMDGNRIIGMSGTYYDNDPPLKDLGTGLTAVRKQYQRQGIATYLKILVTKHYFETYPSLNFITTENAGSNEGMLSINQSLGYKVVDDWHMYQGKVDTTQTIVDGKQVSV